ncbi:MAG TPA: hypothetical protein PKA10_01740 [Selenomonadales bacterium]|nr:hypothetical protein [Selenomonadales bacterium]
MFAILLIGFVVGAALGKLMPGRGLGVVGDLAVGMLGAYAGSQVNTWDLAAYGMVSSGVMTALGAALALWTFRILL